MCPYRSTVSEIKIEKWLLKNLESLLEEEIARVKAEKEKPKAKPKTDVAKLREKLRKVDVRYMNDTITEKEYFAETAELKAAIKKAEAEALANVSDADRDIRHLEEAYSTDFRTIYKELDEEDRRRFWRALIREIKLEGNSPIGVIFF